jgi:hypothetical protein
MNVTDISYGTVMVLGSEYRAETWIKAGQKAIAYGLQNNETAKELTGIKSDKFYFSKDLDVSNTLYTNVLSCSNVSCNELSCNSLYFTTFSAPEETFNPNYSISDACNNRDIIQTIFENFEIVEGYNDLIIAIGTGDKSGTIKSHAIADNSYDKDALNSELNTAQTTFSSLSSISSLNISIISEDYYKLTVTIVDTTHGITLTGSFLDYFTGVDSYSITVAANSTEVITSIYKPSTKTINIADGTYNFDSLLSEITEDALFHSDVTWTEIHNLHPPTIQITNKSYHPYKLSGGFIKYFTDEHVISCPGKGMGDVGEILIVRSNTLKSLGTLINSSTINTNSITCTDLSCIDISCVNANVSQILKVNNTQVSSDRRFKFNRKDIINGLSVVKQLKPQTYFKTNKVFESDKQLNETKEDGFLEAGYIAQDVEQINDISFVVSESNNKLFLNYNSVQPYLCGAIKELSTKNDLLGSIVKEQHEIIMELKGRIELLENK